MSYIAIHDGKTYATYHYIVTYDPLRGGEPTWKSYALNNVNPFFLLGYEKGVALYNDSTKWKVFPAGRTVPPKSFKEIVEDNGFVLDLTDGTVLTPEKLRIKKRIREGYPIYRCYYHDILEWAEQYGRRRLYRKLAHIYPTRFPWGDIVLLRDIIQSRESKDLTIRAPHLLRGRQLYVIYDYVAIREYPQPFYFFVLPRPERDFVLDGLYDGLSGALRAL